jgi:hypothetical protein
MSAKGADKLLKQLLEYFGKKRVKHIGELQAAGGIKARNFSLMCDEVHTLANGLANANVNDTVLRTSIKASEAASSLKKYV